MKIYGETIFDICYLLIAIITGIIIYAKSVLCFDDFSF